MWQEEWANPKKAVTVSTFAWREVCVQTPWPIMPLLKPAMAKRTCKSQVAASWTWVETCAVWQTLMDSQVYSQVHARKTFQGYMPVFHWLIGCFNREWTSLNLCWLGLDGQTAKNFRWLAFKFHLDQTERKSLQINARARPGQMEPQVDPSFQIASTCESVWPGLYILFL